MVALIKQDLENRKVKLSEKSFPTEINKVNNDLEVKIMNHEKKMTIEKFDTVVMAVGRLA